MATESVWRDDADLLSSCRNGDAAAWEMLIRRYRRLVYSIPHACRLDADAADDVFQRVLLKLLEKLPTIRRADALPGWLATTTRRECWAFVRERRRSRGFEEGEAEGVPDQPPDVARDIDHVEHEHALALAFERLGEPCKGLLHALYLEDPAPAYEELARRLGRPIGSVGPTRARCLRKLERLYLRQGGSDPFSAPDASTMPGAREMPGIRGRAASSPVPKPGRRGTLPRTTPWEGG